MEASSKLRVLVVDDSDFSRNNIATMLEGTRYNVIGEAANASEAINILKDRKAHIAIVDVVMPDVSGIELADQLTDMFNSINIVMKNAVPTAKCIV